MSRVTFPVSLSTVTLSVVVVCEPDCNINSLVLPFNFNLYPYTPVCPKVAVDAAKPSCFSTISKAAPSVGLLASVFEICKIGKLLLSTVRSWLGFAVPIPTFSALVIVIAVASLLSDIPGVLDNSAGILVVFYIS